MPGPNGSRSNSCTPVSRIVDAAEPEKKVTSRNAEGMTPAEQLREYERLRSVQGRCGGLQVGNEYYLLNRKWFVQWLQWVGHPSAQAKGARRDICGELSAGAGRLLRAKSVTLDENIDEALPLRLSSVPEVPSLQRTRSWTKDQPGRIDNEILLEDGNPDNLRLGVFEHLDFVILSAAIWDLLHSCYGGGPVIIRHAIRMQSADVQVEVRLLKVRACKVKDHSNVVSCDVSRAATIMELKSLLCRALGLDPSKARILNIDSNEDQSLEVSRIIAGQLFLLDEQRPDGTWACDDDASAASPKSPGQKSDETRVVSPKGSGPTSDMNLLNVRTAGLKNLGNTCFMNSSLQCISNIPQLSDFFLQGRFKESLKICGQATQTTQGKLAESYAELLHALWEDDEEVAPWDFKKVVGRFAERFTGNRQHDSMEFIEFLIDGLKEDCNRVKGRKLYVERADANGRDDVQVAMEAGSKFLLRNDSDIDDLLVGFFKSSVTCPDESCCQESVAFDPFLSLKLPIMSPEKSRTRSFRVDVVPLASSGRSMERHSVTIQKFGGIDLLVMAVATAAGIDSENCVLAEIYKARVYKFFEESDRLEDISSEDILIMYELEDAQAFKKPETQRWGLGGDVKKGDLVFVKQPFESNSQGSVLLEENLCGIVIKVDEDGDANIKFDNLGPQWVFAVNLHNLVVDGAMHDEREKIDPEDDSTFTLKKLIKTYEGEEIDGEVWTISKLLEYWEFAMVDVDVDVKGEISCDPCGVIVSFRKSAQKEEAPEYFGIPIVFCIQRSTPVNHLIKEVRRELKTRNMPIKKNKWTFYKTRGGYSHDAGTLLTEGTDETEETIRFGERQYLVLEWEGEDTPEAGEVLDDVLEVDEEDTVSLDMCLKWMTDREQLSEEDSVYCKSCGDFRRCFKKVDIWSLPPVLVLQLKRFEFTGVQRQRLNTKVQFPLEGLSLENFVLSQLPSFPKKTCLRSGKHVEVHGLTSRLGEKLNGEKGVIQYIDSSTGTARWCVQLDDAPDFLTSITPENLKLTSTVEDSAEAALPIFDLLGVSKHIGDSSFGHYVAYVRSSQDGLWYLFDDEEVAEVSPEDVENEQEGAYVLFYLRRDCRPESWST